MIIGRYTTGSNGGTKEYWAVWQHGGAPMSFSHPGYPDAVWHKSVWVNNNDRVAGYTGIPGDNTVIEIPWIWSF